jgi:hypothetical protein
MEDRKLADLEDAAEDYAKIRDKRVKLTAQEIDTKATLLALMKKHRKTEYNRDGIRIWIVMEQETVKVKITEPGEPQEVGVAIEEKAARIQKAVQEELAQGKAPKRKPGRPKSAKPKANPVDPPPSAS